MLESERKTRLLALLCKSLVLSLHLTELHFFHLSNGDIEFKKYYRMWKIRSKDICRFSGVTRACLTQGVLTSLKERTFV